MPTLQITDNKDGTGAVATIGSVSGTASIKVATLGGSLADLTFNEEATTAVDGAVDLDLDVGAHFAVAIDSGGVSSLVPFRVSDASLGVHVRCIEAIRDWIISLSLIPYPDASYHKTCKIPKRTAKEFCKDSHGVHYWLLDEKREFADTARDAVTYPVEVVLVQANDGSNVIDFDWVKAREILSKSIALCPLDGVDEVHTLKVVPGRIYADTPRELNLDIQSMIFLCEVDQPNILS